MKGHKQSDIGFGNKQMRYLLRFKASPCVKLFKSQAERMQISSRPQYKEVRFSSTLWKNLRDCRLQMQHDMTPLKMQKDQNWLRFMLAAWHRWGVAQAGPITVGSQPVSSSAWTSWPYIWQIHSLTDSFVTSPAASFSRFTAVSCANCPNCPSQMGCLQHHRGLNCRDLHSVAGEGTLRCHNFGCIIMKTFFSPGCHPQQPLTYSN